MRQFKYVLFLLAVPFMSMTAGYATVGEMAVDKLKARKFLVRTNAAIHHAYKMVKVNKNYTGHLSKSIAHQKLARKHFHNRKYVKAVHHSRRARLLAFKAIKANKGRVKDEWKFNSEEKALIGDAPADEKLDKQMSTAMPNVSLDDKEAVKKDPELVIKEEGVSKTGRPGKE